jgi:hypothetical protein
MAFIAMAAGTGGFRWTADGQSIESAKSFTALLETLEKPQALVCEPAFYNGLLDVRRHLENWVEEQGHVLVPIIPRPRVVLVAAGGERIEGRGLKRLYSIVDAGTRGLDRETTRGQHVWAVRDALDIAHALDVSDDAKRVLTIAIEAFGPYESLDALSRHALGNGASYSDGVLLATYRAASVAGARDSYERYLGLNAAAHGEIARTIRGWYRVRNTIENEFHRDSDLIWTDYRRALRMAFHRFNQVRALASPAA